MQIQIRTDNHIEGSVRLSTWIEDQIKNSFERYNDRLTRIEVHVSDTNSSKQGADDKRYMIEARPAGHPPVAVVGHGEELPQALEKAIEKLSSALEHLFGKLNSQTTREKRSELLAEVTADSMNSI